MTVSHHYIEKDPSARMQNQAAIHRKCLLLLLPRPACTAVRPVRHVYISKDS